MTKQTNDINSFVKSTEKTSLNCNTLSNSSTHNSVENMNEGNCLPIEQSVSDNYYTTDNQEIIDASIESGSCDDDDNCSLHDNQKDMDDEYFNEDGDGKEQKPLPSYPTTLEDIDDPIEITYEERVARALANNPQQPCKRNSAKDEKISKYTTYGSIPFFIAAIGVALFDSAKYRSPWSFLLLSLATAVLGVGALLRVLNNKKCPCSLCETQGKNLRGSVAIWGLVSIGAIIAAIVFFII